MPEHDSTPHGSTPTDSSAPADVPRMPDPRVREFAAHSIGGGLALLFGLVGLLLGSRPDRGRHDGRQPAGRAALIVPAS